jgi:hypothetical protein
MTFLTALETELNTTETLNGAKAYKSTLNKCVDLFGKISACRNDIPQARKLFAHAYMEDPETATRILFNARDIRGGQGEREIFRNLFKDLVNGNSEIASKLVELIPVYGRWDDLLILEGTSVWDNVVNVIVTQLRKDDVALTAGENVSLLGKWMPSINASSADSKRLGRVFAKRLGLNERQYRKFLTALRSQIKIVEQKMCAKEWTEIDYEHLPSRAGFMYRKAFAKQDATRYAEYLSAVEKGEKKINAGTIYPYEIVEKYLYKGGSQDKTIDLMWEALPNYMEGQELNGLVVADVSGSMGCMGGIPMAVSISLAMYIAERNTGIWKDKFITFSYRPEIQTIVGNTIGDRIRNLYNADWAGNTDLIAVFESVLNAGIKNNVPDAEMPKKLIIVSDMQFDQACASNKRTNFEQIQKMYRKAGYEMPELVFWNVNAIGGNVPMTIHDTGTCLVSGCSPSILKSVLSGKTITPVDVMKDAVYAERYDKIGEAFSS